MSPIDEPTMDEVLDRLRRRFREDDARANGEDDDAVSEAELNAMPAGPAWTP